MSELSLQLRAVGGYWPYTSAFSNALSLPYGAPAGSTEFAYTHQLELRLRQFSQRCDLKVTQFGSPASKGKRKGTIVIGERSAKLVDQPMTP